MVLAMLANKGIVDRDRAIIGAAMAAMPRLQVSRFSRACMNALLPSPGQRYCRDVQRRHAHSTERIAAKKRLLDQLGPRDRWDEVSPRRFADRADAPAC